MAAFRDGCIVQLKGLTNQTILNGAEGVITGEPRGGAPKRYGVILRDPALAASYPQGLLVKAENLQLVEGHAAKPRAAPNVKKTAKQQQQQQQQGEQEMEPQGESQWQHQPQHDSSSYPGTLGAGAPGTASPAAAAAAATAGGGGGGSDTTDGGLPLPLRTGLVRKCVESFVDALDDDVYPAEGLERIFGVQMHPQTGKKGNDLTTWPIGNLVFGAWITIRSWFFRDRMEQAGEDLLIRSLGGDSQQRLQQIRKEFEDQIMDVMLAGRLPQWYESELRRLAREGKASAYSAEIMKRGFRSITYDTVLLAKFAGRA